MLIIPHIILCAGLVGLTPKLYCENTKSDTSIDSVKSAAEHSNVLILMDFTGNKCKPCKVMKTRLKKLIPEFEGKAKVVFVDVNKERKLTKEYKIRLIPTLVFIDKTGKEVYRWQGEMSEDAVKKKLQELIAE